MITQNMVRNLFERFNAKWIEKDDLVLGLDNYAPPGNKYRWRPVIVNNALNGAEHHPFFNERMNNCEMRAYFMGALFVLDNLEKFKERKK